MVSFFSSIQIMACRKTITFSKCLIVYICNNTYFFNGFDCSFICFKVDESISFTFQRFTITNDLETNYIIRQNDNDYGKIDSVKIYNITIGFIIKTIQLKHIVEMRND